MRFNNLRKHVGQVALLLLAAATAQLALNVDPAVALALAILSVLALMAIGTPRGDQP